MSDDALALDPLELMRRLRDADIPYRVDSIRDDSIMVEVRSPGHIWEIEFFACPPILFERFKSDGKILSSTEMAALLAKWSDLRPPDDVGELLPRGEVELMRCFREAGISFRVDEVMIRRRMIEGAIMIEVAVPGERWEIDILHDDTIEIERFETEFVQEFGAKELHELLTTPSERTLVLTRRRGLRK